MQTLLILLALASSVTNPLIKQRADPHVYRDVSGTYYLTATVPEYDRIVLRAVQDDRGTRAGTRASDLAQARLRPHGGAHLGA